MPLPYTHASTRLITYVLTWNLLTVTSSDRCITREIQTLLYPIAVAEEPTISKKKKREIDLTPDRVFLLVLWPTFISETLDTWLIGQFKAINPFFKLGLA